MVLTRAFACALPVVASDIPGYREVLTPEVALSRCTGRSCVRSQTRSARSSTTSRVARRWATPHASSQSSATAWPAIARAPRSGLRERDRARRCGGARGVTALRQIWNSGWAQAAVAVVAFIVAATLLWWRGPEWGSVLDAFKLVIWSWIVLAFLLNVVSTLFRALSWRLTVGPGASARASAEARPCALVVRRGARSRTRSSRAGSASSRASRHSGAISPMRLPGRARRSWGRSSRTACSTSCPRRSSSSGCCSRPRCRTGRWSRSRSPRPSASRSSRSRGSARSGTTGPLVSEGIGSMRQFVSMARQGLSVLKAPVPLAAAILLQCLGWLMQLLAVYVTMQAFGIDAPLPAAGLVLVLMNIATIVPLWPGNIGLVQAAVALPLRNYGVAYADRLRVRHRPAGDRDRVRRRLGLIAIAREGISFAMLRRMQDDEQSAENALEDVARDGRRARRRRGRGGP